jgi:hypothetical protein
MIIIIATFIGYVIPNVSSNAIVNVLVKGLVVSVVYIGSIYQFKLSPEIFDMVKSKLIKRKN